MKNLIFGLLVSSVLFVFPQSCAAQSAATVEIQPTRYTDTSGTFSFVAPEGWTAKRADGGFGLTKKSLRYLIGVKPHNHSDFESLAASSDVQLDGARLEGEVHSFGDGHKLFRLVKPTIGGKLIVDVFALFSPHGGGVLIICMSDENNADATRLAGAEIVKSINFIKTNKPSAQSTGNSPWHRALAGKRLRYMFTGNGYREYVEIHLCASGGFTYRTESGGFSQGDPSGLSYGAESARSGVWQVTGSAALTLQFRNGNTTRYNLTDRGSANQVGLNGKRFWVSDEVECR